MSPGARRLQGVHVGRVAVADKHDRVGIEPHHVFQRELRPAAGRGGILAAECRQGLVQVGFPTEDDHDRLGVGDQQRSPGAAT